jgi:hypothetical protein
MGLVVPVAYFLTELSCRPVRSDWRLVAKAAAPLITSSAALLVYQVYVSLALGRLMSYRVESGYWQLLFAHGAQGVVSEVASNFLKVSLYLGLLLAPFLPCCFGTFLGRLSARERSLALLVWIEFTVLLSAALILTGNLMPLADNIIFNGGLGPILLRPYGLDTGWPAAARMFWVCVTVLSVAGASCLLAIAAISARRICKRLPLWDNNDQRRAAILLAGTFALYLGFMCLRGFFDRYLIFSLALCIPLLHLMSLLPGHEQGTEALSAFWQRVSVVASAVLLTVYGSLGVAGVHDYFSFNRARWQVLQELLADRISPMDIEGGFEFNGWYGYEPAYRNVGIVFNTGMIHNDRFVVALKPLSGFAVRESLAFDRWLFPGQGQVLVLEKRPQ